MLLVGFCVVSVMRLVCWLLCVRFVVCWVVLVVFEFVGSGVLVYNLFIVCWCSVLFLIGGWVGLLCLRFVWCLCGVLRLAIALVKCLLVWLFVVGLTSVCGFVMYCALV